MRCSHINIQKGLHFTFPPFLIKNLIIGTLVALLCFLTLLRPINIQRTFFTIRGGEERSYLKVLQAGVGGAGCHGGMNNAVGPRMEMWKGAVPVLPDTELAFENTSGLCHPLDAGYSERGKSNITTHNNL